MKSAISNLKAQTAFTLVELLVVVTILVILIAMLMPAMDRAIYHAELAVCASHLSKAVDYENADGQTATRCVAAIGKKGRVLIAAMQRIAGFLINEENDRGQITGSCLEDRR